jgi:hypothetical protein
MNDLQPTMPTTRRLLDAIHATERRRHRLRRAGLAVAATVGGFAVLIVVDAVWPLTVGGMSLAAVLLLTLVSMAAAWGVAAWRADGRGLQHRDRLNLARRIERQVGCDDRTLSSGVALAAVDGGRTDSAALRALAVERGEVMARQLDARALLTVPPSRWPWRVSAALAALLVLTACWQPRLPGAATARLAQPWADLPPYARARVTLGLEREDAAGPLLETERLRLVARVRGPAAVDAAVLVVRRDHEPKARRLPMQHVTHGDGQMTFVAELPADRAPLRLRAQAGDGRSRWMHLQPLAVPRVARLTAEVQPPDALNLPTRLIEIGPGGLDVWPGSMVTIRLEADAALAVGEVEWSVTPSGAVRRAALSPIDDGRTLIATHQVAHPGHARITARGRGGVVMTPAAAVPIRLLSHGPPTVTMTWDAAADLLRIVAEDAQGLERIELALRDAGGEARPLHAWNFPAPGPRAYAVTMRMQQDMAMPFDGTVQLRVTAMARRGQAPAVSAQADWPAATSQSADGAPSGAAAVRADASMRETGAGGRAGEGDDHLAFAIVEAGRPAASTVWDHTQRGRDESPRADVAPMPRVPLQYREAAAAYLRSLTRVTLPMNHSNAGSGTPGDEYEDE